MGIRPDQRKLIETAGIHYLTMSDPCLHTLVGGLTEDIEVCSQKEHLVRRADGHGWGGAVCHMTMMEKIKRVCS